MSIRIHTGSQIFKLQLPIASNDLMLQMLVYNQDRSIEHTFDVSNSPHLVDYVRQDPKWNGYKTFVKGFIEDGLLVIEERVGDQGW